MPPKVEKKRQAVARPDFSGIPKNDVDIKFELLLQPSGQSVNLVALLEWFGQTSQRLQRKESGLVQLLPRKGNSFCWQKQMDYIRVDDVAASPGLLQDHL